MPKLDDKYRATVRMEMAQFNPEDKEYEKGFDITANWYGNYGVVVEIESTTMEGVLTKLMNKSKKRWEDMIANA